jgi:septal ring factor EnvC (AmiA/AmiB activator)
LILNASREYYMLHAGMDRINGVPGEFFLNGEPVGAVGDGSTANGDGGGGWGRSACSLYRAA